MIQEQQKLGLPRKSKQGQERRQKNSHASLSTQDLRHAAQAVVDAALFCHSARGVHVSAEVRAALIQAVFEDPSITSDLLRPDFSGVQ